MTQGRLPAAPRQPPGDAPQPGRAQSDDRRAREEVERLRGALRLEQQKNYEDGAVSGGLDAFLERLSKNPGTKRMLDAAGVRRTTYAELDRDGRAAWIANTLERLRLTARDTPAAPPNERAAPSHGTPPSSQQPLPRAPRQQGMGAPPPVPPTPPTPPVPPTPPPSMEVPPDPSWGRESRQSADTPAPSSASAQTGARGRQTPGRRAAARQKSAGAPFTSLDAPLDAPAGMRAGLNRLGIVTYRDALWAFPRRYVEIKTIASLRPDERQGEQAAILVRVEKLSGGNYPTGRRVLRVEATVSDGTRSVRAVWFGNQWIARRLRRGMRMLLFGRFGEFRGSTQFTVDTYEELRAGEGMEIGELMPIYPLTKGVTQSRIRGLIRSAADRALPLVREHLPDQVIRAARLHGLQDSLRAIHRPGAFPDDDDPARRRLAFDELFLLQLGLLERRRHQQRELGAPIPRSDAAERVVDSLPFTLTDDQKRAVDEILDDMGRSAPMMRLLQGDVGSGKTVVAVLALVTAAAKGFQGALMASTEVLAEQHFRTLTAIFSHGNRDANDGGLYGEYDGVYRAFSGILPDRPLRIALLTGSISAGKKSRQHERVSRGDVDIAIGTHALIQESVAFHNLGLAVVDEQHRFGVEQRASLRNKAHAPHLLVMTATPIPRTMALAVYGDLDVSTIREMPPGRPRIRTAVRSPDQRKFAYDFIRSEAKKGKQSFIICPLVEESEAVAAKAAVTEHERLSRQVFPNLRVGLLHGRMRPAEKDRVMEEFRGGEIDVLVSTAVVEVGIDVPNATVMLIDGAERFGLAQLHQYRGRIGRGTGGDTNYCILVSESETDEVNNRLNIMESVSDGFQLAEEDLKIRGPGELLGTRQSGVPDLRVATFTDLELIEEARRQALAIARGDPELREDTHAALREELRRFWARVSDAPEGG